MAYTYNEDKVFILTKSNEMHSYSCDPGANLQRIIDFFKKDKRLPIVEVYLQPQGKGPTNPVGSLYNIE